MQMYEKYLNQIAKSSTNLSTEFELLSYLEACRIDNNLTNGKKFFFDKNKNWDKNQYRYSIIVKIWIVTKG